MLHKRFFVVPTPPGTIPVKISAKNARLLFEGCSGEFIQNICKGMCCHIKGLPEGTIIRVEPDQQSSLKKLGAKFEAGIMQTVNARCFFFAEDTGFCNAHLTPYKPKSCIQAPFILNKKDTLIVRNRYKMLKCYRAEGAVPAYIAFRAAFNVLFGRQEAKRIVAHLDNGGGDITGYMLKDRYQFVKEVATTWHAGMFNREEFDKIKQGSVV